MNDEGRRFFLQEWILVNYPIDDYNSDEIYNDNQDQVNQTKEKVNYSVYDFFVSFIKKIVEL